MRIPISTARGAGTTVPELLITVSIFSLLLILLFLVFSKGMEAVQASNARHQAQISLNKAHPWLSRDLPQADPGQIQHKRVASPSGNGDAVWFLSAEDPTESDPDLRFRRSGETGAPIYQTQILYYLIRPVNYSDVADGLTASIDPNPNNDFFAPHKFLIRKVIDTPSDPETLLSPSDIDAYITPPVDYSLSPFNTEANVLDYKLVSDKMLSFEVESDGTVVSVRASALRIDEARREIPVGTVSLEEHPLTVFREMAYKLKN